MRFVRRQSTSPWTFAVFAALSPLIDTSQMWVAFAQNLPLAMRIRWSLSLIFLDFKYVTMWICSFFTRGSKVLSILNAS